MSNKEVNNKEAFEELNTLFSIANKQFLIPTELRRLQPLEQLRLNETDQSNRPTLFLFLNDKQPVYKQLSACLDELTTWITQSLLGFLLLISMGDDVAKWLVVDVSSGVNGSQSEGLIHLEVYEVTLCLVKIIVLKNTLRVCHYKK